MKRKISLFILLLLATAFSASDPPLDPEEEMIDLFNIVQSLLILLMITFAAIAASGFVFAQMFGAETRAKIQAWSTGLLAAIGVSALVIILFAFFVPIFSGGGEPDLDIEGMLKDLSDLAQQSLLFVIIVMIVLSAAVYTIGQMFGAETRAKANVWSQILLGSSIVATIIYVLIAYVFVGLISPELSYNIDGKPVDFTPYTTALIFVIFIISSIVLITYLAAKIFKVPEWEAYLSIELSHLVNSFILLVFVLGLFAVSSAVAISIAGGESSPPLAAVHVVRGFTETTLEATTDVYTIQACTSVLSTFHRRIGEAVLTPTFRLFPGIDTFVSITNVLAIGFVMVYGSLSAQIALLNVIDALMVPFILPAGLILRFFPPTREAGAFLIALAFGFQIVFPTAYILNGMALVKIGLAKEVDGKIVPEVYNSKSFPISALCGMSYAYFSLPVVLLGSGFPLLSGTLNTIFSEGVIHGLSMSLFIPILRALSAVSLLALFAPSISMLLTVASINAMTKFIVMKG